MRKIVCIVVLFLSLTSTWAQKNEAEFVKFLETASNNELLRKNTELLLFHNYYQSIRVIDKLLAKEPDNANFNYRKGYALLNSQSDFTLPLPFLEIAVANTTKVFDASTAKESDAPRDAIYYLAKCYHLNNKIKKAREHYQNYLDITSHKNILYKWAELGLAQCLVAERELRFPKNYEIMNMGSVINTDAPEYSPVISLDGSALYFTSRRLWPDSMNINMKDSSTNFYWEDVYVSYKDFDDEWIEPVRLDFCKPNQNEATVSVSSNERKVFIYNDATGNGDIYYADFHTGRFDQIRPVEIEGVNTPAWEPHLTISPDGQMIFFVSDREGGYGGRDIYRIVKLPDGSWSLPSNLGPKINTPYDEDAPFISVDNRTLYFSSNGQASMGGFDIFISILGDDGDWTPPLNLGFPLNSTSDDIFFTTTSDGSKGYFTSFREGGQGEKDIYEVKNNFLGKQILSMLKGEIVVADNKLIPEHVAVTIDCLDCGERSVVTLNYPRIRDGVYFSTVEKNRTYEITYTHHDGAIEFYKDTIVTNSDSDYEEIGKRVLLNIDDMTIVPYVDYLFTGVVTDKEDGKLMAGAKVEFINDNNEVLHVVKTDENGYFESNVLKRYLQGEQPRLKVRVTQDDYITQVFEFNKMLAKSKGIHKEYTIEKPKVGIDLAKTLELNPIYFDLDKSDIRPDARIELDKIVEIMNDNPNMVIVLGSHTDCRGDAKYNMKLSQRRATSSAEYIQSRITDPMRIVGKGYGESKLVNNCPCEGKVLSDCSDEEHQANRRTEFRVVEMK
jgi:outer membrane protein OmpA-like peptidoglycan-associated protein/tetratricopeptide (TPR) repeat protein